MAAKKTWFSENTFKGKVDAFLNCPQPYKVDNVSYLDMFIL